MKVAEQASVEQDVESFGYMARTDKLGPDVSSIYRFFLRIPNTILQTHHQ